MTDLPVIGVLFLLVVFSAPWWIRRLRSSAPEETLRVVGRTAISRNAVVAVIRVGDRRLLVGAGEHGVNVLTELEPEERTEEPTSEPGARVDLRVGARHDAGPELPFPDLPDVSALDLDFDEESTDVLLDLGRLAGPADAHAGLTGLAASSIDRPRIGRLDRLRAMTVRTTPTAGRPIRVPNRR